MHVDRWKMLQYQEFSGKSEKTSLNNNTIINGVSSNLGTDETSISSEKYIDNSSLISSTFLQDEEGKFYTSFELPKFYYQKLQTQKHFDIKSLSEKTNTNIIIPEIGQEGKLKIVGDNEDNLQVAINEIHAAIGFIRDKNVALQFATIPLLSKEIQSNFEKFKKEVLEDEELANIDQSIFLKKEKLHLTINIFVLHGDKELKEAENALNDYKNYHLVPLLRKTGPLKISVEGIDCMKSNYKKVDVIYARATLLNETEEATLQKIADQLSLHFYERGLLKRPQESVKLHMTLMNVKFRKVPGKKKFSKRQSIDATKLMAKYRDYKFGTCDFNSIRIAHISAKPDKDGFYKTLSEVNLH